MARFFPPAVVLTTLLASLLLARQASAIERQANEVEVGFHISHPAKQYDAGLLPGGATAVATFDPGEVGNTRVEVLLKVDFFNSANELRDSHMLEVLEAIIFPTISWAGVASGGAKGPFNVGTHEITVKGPLTVHGVTRELEIPVRLEVAASGLVTAHSKFSISIESFEIERPSLVFVKIKDELPITVKMAFAVGSELFTPQAPEPAAAVEQDSGDVPPGGAASVAPAPVENEASEKGSAERP